jgi:WD40 repeat protein
LRHSAGVLAVAYCPDSGRVATADETGAVCVWEAGTGRRLLILREHRLGVYALAFSPDGRRLASGGADNLIKVWDLPPMLR